MNDSIEFTHLEKYLLSVHQDPERLAKWAVMRSLCFLVPSIVLVACSFFSGDISYGIMGYCILAFVWVYQMRHWKQDYKETATIFRKYEAQLQAKQNAA
jgi:hypothetical protein